MSDATLCALSLGSNVGDRAAHIRRAVGLIGAGSEVVGASAIYETEPWGLADQRPFFNACLVIRTRTSAPDLLRAAKDAEREIGRTESRRWGPREIDIDILLYGKETIVSEGLTVPHIHMHKRAFVLVPLAEIAPSMVHPPSGLTVAELLRRLEPREVSGVTRVI